MIAWWKHRYNVPTTESPDWKLYVQFKGIQWCYLLLICLCWYMYFITLLYLLIILNFIMYYILFLLFNGISLLVMWKTNKQLRYLCQQRIACGTRDYTCDDGGMFYLFWWQLHEKIRMTLNEIPYKPFWSMTGTKLERVLLVGYFII